MENHLEKYLKMKWEPGSTAKLFNLPLLSTKSGTGQRLKIFVLRGKIYGLRLLTRSKPFGLLRFRV